MESNIGEKPKKQINFRPWDPKKDKKILRFIVITSVLIASFIIIKDEINWQLDEFLSSEEEIVDDYTDEDFGGSDCNVQAVVIHGDLVTYISPENYDEDWNPIIDQSSSEDIVYQIETAEEDDSIKAIIVEIDSYGGWPVADEEVANSLKRANKPTVALIRGAGVSAAYYAATGADLIFASADSDVGSIGVTMSYLDESKLNQAEGYTYNQLSSGKFKDAGDLQKPLTYEERQLFMRDINILNENFIKAVAENRGLDSEKVRRLADGSSMLGQMALENGLIDRIGGEYDVKDYLAEMLGEEIEVCW